VFTALKFNIFCLQYAAKKIFISNLPDLIEIQKTSFCWFLEKGLEQELNKFSLIVDYTDTYQIRFHANEFYFRKPTLTISESKWNEKNIFFKCICSNRNRK